MNKNIKNLIISIVTIIMILLAYFFLPKNVITRNISAIKEKIFEEELISGITASGYVEDVTETILREHRGYKVIGTESGTDYDSATGNTGIKDKDELDIVLGIMNNPNSHSPWIATLQKNTSIFCHAKGQPLPSVSSAVLRTFHSGEIDISTASKGDKKTDIVEAIVGKGCEGRTISLIVEVAGAEEKTQTISESELDFSAGKTYEQKTRSGVEYNEKTAIQFSIADSYIFSYSERKTYKKDQAQFALWLNTGASEKDIVGSSITTEEQQLIEKGENLYHVAKAVENLSATVKPTMSKGTNTGTIIEGTNYKVGPIKMEDYTFGWSDIAGDYTGNLIAGITEVKVILDNENEIILNNENYFSFDSTEEDRLSKCSEEHQTGVTCNETLWRAPTKSDGYFYPTPDSEFYILLPINLDALKGATKIEKIVVNYKYTTAEGSGWELNGTFKSLTWEAALGTPTDCKYKCDTCYNDDLSFAQKNSHTYICIEPGTEGGYCGECGGTCKGHYKRVCNGHHEHDQECYSNVPVQGELDCEKEEHTHTNQCKHEHGSACGYMYTDANGIAHYSCQKKFDCGKEEHNHTPWHGENSPGCYYTIYVKENSANKCPWGGMHTELARCYEKEYHTDYCKHGYKNGNHGTTKASGSGWTYASATCTGPTKCNSHEHENCYNLTWTAKEQANLDTQELYAVQKAQIIEKTGTCTISNIPLVAKVEINKYISDVNHYNEDAELIKQDEEFEKYNNDRQNLSENTKLNNPVFVEYGDFVTYTLELTNYSAFDVSVKIKDIIPDGAIITGININDENILEESKKLEEQILKISGETTGYVYVTVQVDQTEGKYYNVTQIISRNNGNVDYLRTADNNGPLGPVVNNSSVTITGTTSEPKVESKDWYILNDYKASINKYISGYDSQAMIDNNNNKFTEEENELTDRTIMSEQEKATKPFQVEKGDVITYTIEVKNEAQNRENEAVTSGTKKATVIKPSRVEEILQTGLEYNSISAEVFKSDKSKKYNQNINVSCTSIGNNTYAIDTPRLSNGEEVTLNPGEYIRYTVRVKVIESNMYLKNLSNTAILTRLKNVNNRFIKHEGNIDGISEVDRNISEQEMSSDYVKMKDLVIAGKVWLDKDKDGLMNDSAPMKDIVVKLYEVGTGHGGTDTVVRTTKTDENGLYTFAKNENGNWYNGQYSYGDSVTESEQRIPKATEKDSNHNYTESSKYIKYYIEYEYDGLKYKSTEIYAGNSNLGENGELDSEGKYKIDSNAAEFKEKRRVFDEKYEIIAYNTAYTGGGSDQFDLSYKKDGHNSWLTEDKTRVMTSRSFINKDNSTTNYLWLYEQNEDATLPETEYLKYINLGLEERDNFDLSISQDVYEVKTTINGDQMTYEYNQNDYTLGNAILDKEQNVDDTRYNSLLYMTGYENDSSSLLPYVFEIYNSDYNYKVSQYNIDTVKDYKGTESELNVEVTYRIRVTNNTTEGQVYAGINEIAEYYDSDFVDFELEDDEIKTINIKTKDENGYLVNTPIKVVNAEFVMQDGTRKEATVSDGSLYDDGSKDTKCLFIRSKLTIENNKFFHGDIMLAPGESLDVLITFVVDKDEKGIILGDKTNIAEINAYSTYYKEGDTYYSAGLIDHDSNPGNFKDNLSEYEDDTFKTGIKTLLQQDVNNERVLTGFVWDDARTITAIDESGVQYIGDGKYDTSINAIAEAKKNQKVSNKEETDLPIKDMKVQLVEMIAIPQDDGTVRVYEDVIKVDPTNSKMEARTDDSGQYQLKGYIPGNYIVKFAYGDDETLDNMLIFNGQDYKSTTYQATEEKYAENTENVDEVLHILEKTNISDAKDDEIKRLETISYSETITNNINTILRGQDSSNKTSLVGNTKMQSETPQFYVKTEKELSSKNVLTYFETMAKFEPITSETISARHQIKNIDFGIEYRPELQVSLDKYIANVKVTTSDSNATTTATPLINAKFKEYYGIVTQTNAENGKTEFLKDDNQNIIKVNKNATNSDVEEKVNSAGADISKCQKTSDGLYVITIAGTELDKENSVGLNNLQYVENISDTQGFAYLNIDDEIMQGANISIEYLMVANNLSEIDRVSSNLSSLRFKENAASKAYSVGNAYYDQVSYQLGDDTGYVELDYSGAKTARNKLFSEYYGYELDVDNAIKKDKSGNDIIYRIKTKDIIVDDNKKISDEGYYGRYLGSLYYTGVIGVKDIVAELKIDKILDYIDNDLVFNESENNGLNGRWKTTTSQELYNSNLVSKLSFIGGTASGEEALVGAADNIQLVDNKNRAFDTSERSNLAILVDDRIKDYASDEEDVTINKNISKYLMPRYANAANSYGTVNLVASKIISPEDLTEDMTYDNIAEIVQYSSVTGRVTSLTTTLGNAAFFKGDDVVSEWEAATSESDTSATEKVTLTPPTGLGRVQQIVRNTVEGASYTLLIVFAVTIVCVGVFVGIRLYRKRPIK